MLTFECVEELLLGVGEVAGIGERAGEGVEGLHRRREDKS